ncbi:tRNA preQ1(34) S-adenosylmethionine ribosyltransferase-isomerase QueA [Oricola cellulosilytica]|uniref:S-adenosylmethionine:tRNA ribosyltransferase-isomerase n=1 Tax=Oricola cellulosilytica TaxID=1429082 RepID=A0A4R0P8F7_9HYPH|nr:tRNA preQ1(34) S-adenosylmethionine ribosyltransferase-isomerase QueA [Oricola cellulosilytica]TCD13125.1 tRNA preQ1(34) S-adenosylmethionine ribosyltransferase-isomerase QueA [Oricola cellulosilytica]
MRVDSFDFELPDERIAVRPAVPRDSARMLVVKPGEALSDSTVLQIPELLRAGDVLVFNDTKVIPAQLEGVRTRSDGGTARIGATLHLRTAPDRWKAFIRGAKKLKTGDRITFDAREAAEDETLDGVVHAKGEDGEAEIAFNRTGADLDAALAVFGHIPLPPYIASKRDDDDRDREDYQTIYAREQGAVAAPTAGLHFTERLFEALDQAGIIRTFVTLHVGAGTFLPVKADDTKDHRMHAEIGEINTETADMLNKARANGGRVVSVGTTSLRLLESAARADGSVAAWAGPTDIFITPGYRFKAVDILITNFHLPRSTLFMLVAAFSGLETMRGAYQHAIDARYRFYSYGDASMIFPATDERL